MSNSLQHRDCSLPGSSVHGILLARIVEWVSMPSSKGSSNPCIKSTSHALAGRFFTTSGTWEAHYFSQWVSRLSPEIFQFQVGKWTNDLKFYKILSLSLLITHLCYTVFFFLFYTLRNALVGYSSFPLGMMCYSLFLQSSVVQDSC